VKDSDRPSATDFPLTNNSSKWEAQQAQAQPQTNQPRKTPARPHTAWTYTKRALAALVCMAAMAAGTVLGNFYWNSSLFRRIVHNTSLIKFITTGDPMEAMMASYTPEQQFPPDKQHIITLAILGCDRDYEDARPVPIKGKNTRSDTIIVARIDFDSRTIRAMSIPRDTAVIVPGHGYHKINAAHAFGGPELTQQTIKNAFGIDTDYYVTLDFDGFQKVVNAVGGVDINVEKQLDYDDNWGNLHVHLKPGLQHLNGYQAMGYVRMRHSDNDLMRAERQHAFLEALRERIKDKKNFFNLPKVLNALSDSIKSNLNQDQLLTLANWARQLPKENLNIATLPVIEGPSFCYVKATQSADLIGRLFFDGNPQAVTINVPGRSLIARGDDWTDTGWASPRRNRRHRRHRWSHLPASVPRDDDGAPLEDTTGESAPMGDTGSTESDSGAAREQDSSPGMGRDSGDSGRSERSSTSDTGKSGGDSGTSSAPEKSPQAPSDGGSDSGAGTGDQPEKPQNG